MQEHVVCMKGLKTVHKICVRKPEGKRVFGRLQCGPGERK